MSKKPYWVEKSFNEYTPQEWEQLCDGCAKCCLHKLEDDDSGEIHQTNVCCQYLDLETSAALITRPEMN